MEAVKTGRTLEEALERLDLLVRPSDAAKAEAERLLRTFDALPFVFGNEDRGVEFEWGQGDRLVVLTVDHDGLVTGSRADDSGQVVRILRDTDANRWVAEALAPPPAR